MNPDELRAMLALLQEFRVSHFKRGDLDITIELSPAGEGLDAIGEAAAIPRDAAKYWSAPEPEPAPDEPEKQ